MNEVIVIGGLILLVGLIFYLLVIQNNRQLKNIDSTVYKEAKIKGFQIKDFIYPTFSEWKNSPFDKEIKFGSLGLDGIPHNREYFRILKYQDLNSNSEKTIWVRVTRSFKTEILTLEWKDETTN